MTDRDLAAAWAEAHEATPEGWYVGRPYFNDRYNQWEQYAYDPSGGVSSSRAQEEARPSRDGP